MPRRVDPKRFGATASQLAAAGLRLAFQDHARNNNWDDSVVAYCLDFVPDGGRWRSCSRDPGWWDRPAAHSWDDWRLAASAANPPGTRRVAALTPTGSVRRRRA